MRAVSLAVAVIGFGACIEWDAVAAREARCRSTPTDPGCPDAGTTGGGMGGGGGASGGSGGGAGGGTGGGSAGGAGGGTGGGTGGGSGGGGVALPADAGALWLTNLTGVFVTAVTSEDPYASVIAVSGNTVQVHRYGSAGPLGATNFAGVGFPFAAFERAGILAVVGRSASPTVSSDAGFANFYRVDGGSVTLLRQDFTNHIGNAVNLFPTDAGRLDSAVFGSLNGSNNTAVSLVVSTPGGQYGGYEWPCNQRLRVDRVLYSPAGDDGVIAGAATVGGTTTCMAPNLILNGTSGAFVGRFGQTFSAGPLPANIGTRVALGYAGGELLVASAGANAWAVYGINAPPPLGISGTILSGTGDFTPVELVGHDPNNWWLIGHVVGPITIPSRSLSANAPSRDIAVIRVRAGNADRISLLGGLGNQTCTGAALLGTGTIVIAGQCDVPDGGSAVPFCTGPGTAFVFGMAGD